MGPIFVMTQQMKVRRVELDDRYGGEYGFVLEEVLKNPPPIPSVTEMYARAAPNPVSQEDDAVPYTEPSIKAPEPPCKCDIMELALGKGHDPDCPHYKEHQ